MRWALMPRRGCGKVAFYILGPKPVDGEKFASDSARDLEGNPIIPHSLALCLSCGKGLRMGDIRTAFLEEASE